jgi:DNA-binding transcriptional MerR regulator
VLREAFSTDDLIRLADLPSRHMVAYLCRCELLHPSLSRERKRGRARQFSFQDIVLARVLSKLLSNGVSVANLKRALGTLREKLRITPERMRLQHVAIIGQKVFMSETPSIITELTADGQLAFCFMLQVDDLLAELRTRRSSVEAA